MEFQHKHQFEKAIGKPVTGYYSKRDDGVTPDGIFISGHAMACDIDECEVYRFVPNIRGMTSQEAHLAWPCDGCNRYVEKNEECICKKRESDV